MNLILSRGGSVAIDRVRIETKVPHPFGIGSWPDPWPSISRTVGAHAAYLVTVRDLVVTGLNDGMAHKHTDDFVHVATSDPLRPMDLTMTSVAAQSLGALNQILALSTSQDAAPLTAHLTDVDLRDGRTTARNPATSGFATLAVTGNATARLTNVDLTDPGDPENLRDIAGCPNDYDVLTDHLLDPAQSLCPRPLP